MSPLNIAFKELCRLFVNKVITSDMFLDLLHQLLETYRKEKKSNGDS